MKVAGLVELEQQAVGAEFDIVQHPVLVDAQKVRGYGLGGEFLFNLKSREDAFFDLTQGDRVDQLIVEETSKVAMESFISRNKLVRASRWIQMSWRRRFPQRRQKQ